MRNQTTKSRVLRQFHALIDPDALFQHQKQPFLQELSPVPRLVVMKCPEFVQQALQTTNALKQTAKLSHVKLRGLLAGATTSFTAVFGSVAARDLSRPLPVFYSRYRSYDFGSRG